MQIFKDIMIPIISTIITVIISSGIIGIIIKKFFETKIEKAIEHNYKIKYDSFKKEIDKEIEGYKVKLKLFEFIYPKQLESLQELYNIYKSIIPEFNYPDKDYYDACYDIACSFDNHKNLINNFLKKYANILPEKIIRMLENAEDLCETGKFGVSETTRALSDESYENAKKFWDLINKSFKKLKKILIIET